jgi:hypothetical protein
MNHSLSVKLLEYVMFSQIFLFSHYKRSQMGSIEVSKHYSRMMINSWRVSSFFDSDNKAPQIEKNYHE